MTDRDRLNVLLVQPSPVRGGAEESLLELVTRSQRVDFTLACLADGPYVDDLEAAGVNVVRLRAKRLRYPHSYLRTTIQLARLAFENDVVLGWQVKANYYGTPAARIAGRPVAWWDHGIRPDRGEPRYFIDNALPSWTYADLVLTSSAASASRHPRSKSILPGIPLDRFSAPDRRRGRELLGVGDDALVLGFVGRLQPWKGAHVLIEALPAIRQQHPEARVVIVGSDVGGFSEGYPAELERLVLEHGVDDAVEFLGYREDVDQLLPGFDRFIQASVGEPFGLVTVEAMASGVPVIATASGGTLEIIDDGETGTLVPPMDAGALASAVLSSIENPSRTRLMADQAVTRVRERFAIARYVREIEDTLIALSEGRP